MVYTPEQPSGKNYLQAARGNDMALDGGESGKREGQRVARTVESGVVGGAGWVGVDVACQWSFRTWLCGIMGWH